MHLGAAFRRDAPRVVTSRIADRASTAPHPVSPTMSSPNAAACARCASRSPICSGKPARSVTWTFPRGSTGLDNGAATVPDDEPVRDRRHARAHRRGHRRPRHRARSVDAPRAAAASSPSRARSPCTSTSSSRRAPLEGETYQLDEDVIDLEPLVRDALLLELPLRRCAATDCAGICARPAAPTGTPPPCDCAVDESDPRWAALRSLETLITDEECCEWPSRSAR